MKWGAKQRQPVSTQKEGLHRGDSPSGFESKEEITMAETLVALYDNFGAARAAVEELVEAGLYRDDISIVTSDSSGEYAHMLNDWATQKDDNVTAGEGSLFGSVVGALVGLGMAMIPGVGPVLAAGPLVSALTGGVVGGAAGAVTGGIVAALVHLDLPEEEASYYAEGVRRGGTLVAVMTSEDFIDEAENILLNHDPVDIEQRVEMWRTEGWSRFDPNAAPYTVEQVERERSLYRNSYLG
jgi:hypothetical protein